jgi:hypothetical protein
VIITATQDLQSRAGRRYENFFGELIAEKNHVPLFNGSEDGDSG